MVEPVLQGLQPEEGLGACNGITVAASEPPKDASSGAFGKNKIGRNGHDTQLDLQLLVVDLDLQLDLDLHVDLASN